MTEQEMIQVLQAHLRGEITLRDWFAGQAVIGLYAATADPNSSGLSPEHAADYAYKTADAMLERRKK